MGLSATEEIVAFQDGSHDSNQEIERKRQIFLNYCLRNMSDTVNVIRKDEYEVVSSNPKTWKVSWIIKSSYQESMKEWELFIKYGVIQMQSRSIAKHDGYVINDAIMFITQPLNIQILLGVHYREPPL